MTHDVLIVGGGITGLTLACALAQQSSLSIAILEENNQPLSWRNAGYYHRVSAITLASQRIFQALNVWDKIKEMRISPFTHIHVWDHERQGEIHFDSKEIAAPALGFIIENNVMQLALREKLKQCLQVEFFSPVQLASFHSEEGRGARLTTIDGQHFNAKLAVAADGAQSWLRQQSGIAVETYAYEQQAIVATVSTALPHQHVARQVFLATGPLAFLPLAGAYDSSIVWSLPTELAQEHMQAAPDVFKVKLARAFSHQLGAVLTVDRCHAFPLYKQQAKNYIHPHLALVGDAAHSVHPLAGQGVNMGLLDVASLTEIIVENIQKGRDFSRLHHLRPYERWRRADNFTLLAGIHAIKNLFATEKKSIQTLRRFGITMLDQQQFLKNIFTCHAVGNRKNLPKLAAVIV